MTTIDLKPELDQTLERLPREDRVRACRVHVGRTGLSQRLHRVRKCPRRVNQVVHDQDVPARRHRR